MDVDIRKYLLLFFVRPTEPCFMPKGEDNIAFKIPERYYAKYYDVVLRLSKRVGSVLSCVVNDEGFLARIIDILDIDLPDLSLPLQLPRHAQFSIFLPKHQEMATKLVQVFLDMKTLPSLLAIAVYCQLHMNPFLFIYSLSIALLHRPDTKGIQLPTFAETFPDMFVDRVTMNRAMELIYILPTAVKRPEVEIEEPKVYIPEQRVAYFRDDFGVNSHHWHWHLIYPGNLGSGVIVDKDRRGELFYYMHHQILARYNTERLCNELERTKPFKDLHENIADGVFPKLDSKNASRSWALRFDNVVLQDVDRVDGTKITLEMMEIWRGRILEAIKDMTVKKADGTSMPLDEETGIDILGNLVEATSLSVNEAYYGSFHNQGHNLISLIHDPKGYHGELSTVMGDTATAMRDPFFYRWHTYINDIFLSFKDKFAPYGSDKLGFPDITVASIGVRGADGEDIDNSFATLKERSVINLKNGLDFSRKRNVYAGLTYLQHEEFRYVIEVNNNSGTPQVGTVRIFMAPTLDEKGAPLNFEEQRKLMIEMDKFVQQLQPGKTTIERRSTESSVTVPYERILRGESEQLPSAEAEKNLYCDCGWPQNMLLPRGNQAGYPVVLFVMVSNWKEDKVEDVPSGCKDNASYCGLRDRKYPDRRAMGFPFDRRAPAAALPAFLLPNMAILNCTIKFYDFVCNKDEPHPLRSKLLSLVEKIVT